MVRMAMCAWVVAAAGWVAPASAQSTTFELEGEGDWVQTRAPAPGSDEAALGEARRLLAEDKPGAARSILDEWIEENEFSGSDLLPEAYLLRGDAKTADGDEYKALFDYETVIKEYSGSDVFARALERELEIAIRYVNGLRRKFLGIRFESAELIGEELLLRVQERLPGSRLAERAGIELADYYYRKRDMKFAAIAYEGFLANYPNSQYRKRAMQRRVYANIARFKGPEYDASPLQEADLLIEDFERLYPADAEQAGLNDALQSRLEESLAAQMLSGARWYLRQDDVVSAKFTIRRMLREHPGTVAATRARQLAEDRGWEDLAAAVAAPLDTAPETATGEPNAEGNLVEGLDGGSDDIGSAGGERAESGGAGTGEEIIAEPDGSWPVEGVGRRLDVEPGTERTSPDVEAARRRTPPQRRTDEPSTSAEPRAPEPEPTPSEGVGSSRASMSGEVIVAEPIVPTRRWGEAIVAEPIEREPQAPRSARVEARPAEQPVVSPVEKQIEKPAGRSTPSGAAVVEMETGRAPAGRPEATGGRVAADPARTEPARFEPTVVEPVRVEARSEDRTAPSALLGPAVVEITDEPAPVRAAEQPRPRAATSGGSVVARPDPARQLPPRQQIVSPPARQPSSADSPGSPAAAIDRASGDTARALSGRAVALETAAQQDLAAGRYDEAQLALSLAADLRGREAEARSGDFAVQRRYWKTLSELGGVRARRGEHRLAVEDYERGLLVMERASGLKPDDVGVVRDMMVAASQAGASYRALGDAERASAMYERVRALNAERRRRTSGPSPADVIDRRERQSGGG